MNSNKTSKKALKTQRQYTYGYSLYIGVHWGILQTLVINNTVQ